MTSRNDVLLPLLIAVLAMITLTACSGRKVKGTVIAQVNDESLYLEDVKAQIGEEEWNNLSPDKRRQYIENWVILTLLSQEADNLDLVDSGVAQQIDLARKKVKANALIAAKVSAVVVSEEDMFNYYRLHQGEFRQPLKEYRIQRIFLNNYGTMDHVRREIQSGLSFSQAVDIYSQENLRDTGGFMDFVTHNGTDSLFWQAANRIQRNQVDAVQKDRGWFLIRWTEERDSREEAVFDDIKDEIRRRIQQERRNQIYENSILDLKSRNKIYYY